MKRTELEDENASTEQTPKHVMKLAQELNRTGADDGEPDPESGSNQVVGVNRVDKDDPDLPAGDKPAAEKEPAKVNKKG